MHKTGILWKRHSILHLAISRRRLYRNKLSLEQQTNSKHLVEIQRKRLHA